MIFKERERCGEAFRMPETCSNKYIEKRQESLQDQMMKDQNA